MNKKVLIVQRVLTSYRFELLQELAPHVKELGFASSQGENEGTLKGYEPENIKYNNVKIHTLNAFKLHYSGDSRSTSLFIYPQILKILKHYDTIVLEGTTNLINNIFIIPYAKVLGKKVLWWDAGYSLKHRTFKRKIIDNAVKPFIKMTEVQLAYSTKAQKYMQTYMGANNCHLLLNTIYTEYFESMHHEIAENIKNKSFHEKNVKLLYVGVVEERKKVKELIDIVHEMNKTDKNYTLIVIGGGNFLDFLKNYTKQKNIDFVNFTGPIYDKDKLKQYYFNADLFVLPGDGGLGILQSLLFGLPAVCLAADGTEEDYLPTEFILNNLNDLKQFNFSSIKQKFTYGVFLEKIKSEKFIKKLSQCLK